MMAVVVRSVAAAVLLATWAYFVAIGKTGIEPLIDFIKLTLGGLAAHTLMKGESKP